MASRQMENNLFNLKLTVKELQRLAKKCSRDELIERTKIKKSIQQGNMDIARIHAENAIRHKLQHTNYLRMSARVDAVTSRIQSALVNRQLSQSMTNVCKAMEQAMQNLNLEKVSECLDQFEKQFETLDVRTTTLDEAMAQTSALSSPGVEVDQLMKQVADEAGLELQYQLPDAAKSGEQMSQAQSTGTNDLDEQLSKLRNN